MKKKQARVLLRVTEADISSQRLFFKKEYKTLRRPRTNRITAVCAAVLLFAGCSASDGEIVEPLPTAEILPTPEHIKAEETGAPLDLPDFFLAKTWTLRYSENIKKWNYRRARWKRSVQDRMSW